MVHIEDLFLHDATRDIRTPTHKLTIARDVPNNRQRMSAQPPGWALRPHSLRGLRGHGFAAGVSASSHSDEGIVVIDAGELNVSANGEGEEKTAMMAALDAEFVAIDAALGSLRGCDR
ncbi:hypothetical protein [Pararhizobium sp. PWRC1-1]|uniref:hypothetical protein n=1 Tax=Pararhizobium sp. PWRC1-1 TaxID=2804566 RepID=UPI003CF9FB1A